MCALLDSCVRGTKAYAQTFKHQFSKGRHFRIMTNILDQVSFKAEYKNKNSDYINYILSNTTELLGSGPSRE